jgi:hypothetical protein
MNRRILLVYQLVIGASDTVTGALLITTPGATLSLMKLHAPADALPFISFIGAFVFAVGMSCLYGVVVMARGWSRCRLETIWLLTAFIRASVAILIVTQVLAHALETGWIMIGIFDGGCAIAQAIGLRRGWLADAE